MVCDWTQLLAVFILVLTFWGIVRFNKQLASPNGIIALFIAMMVVIALRWCDSMRRESFVDPGTTNVPTSVSASTTTSTPSVTDMIREYGFTSIQALKNFTKGDYNEDLSDIYEDSSLTLYYSVFSNNSAPMESSRVWKNISTYFQAKRDTSCKDVAYEKTHLEFDETPYVNRIVGLEMLSNNISGPLSHQCGLQGNGTFSIFAVIKFNGFSANNTHPYEIIKLFGNTMNNNAITLSISPQPVAQTTSSPQGPVPTNIYNCKINVTFGTQTIEAVTDTGSSDIPIDTTKKYMFVVTKTNKKLSLTLHDMSKKTGTPVKLINGHELTEPSVSFSNKEMALNTHKNLNANVFAVGTYNLYLVDETRLHTHMYNEIFKTSDEFMTIARNILNMQQQIDAIKACPYDKSVCDQCNVEDWTDIQKVMTSSTECKQAIDTYCSKNLDDPKCKCWDPMNTAVECKSYINIFRKNNCFQIENIDVETLQKIKNKYNLCECKEIEKIVDSIKPIQQPLPTLTNADVKASEEDAVYYGTSLTTALDNKELLKETQPKKGFWAWLFGF
jgi:hypothetical protein